jgi:glutaredoxin
MIDITVLSQADCPFCDHAAAVLDRVGQDYPLAVRRLGLDTDEGRRLASRHQVLFAPGIVLDGQLFSYGRLSERRLRRHLTRHSQAATTPQG